MYKKLVLTVYFTHDEHLVKPTKGSPIF